MFCRKAYIIASVDTAQQSNKMYCQCGCTCNFISYLRNFLVFELFPWLEHISANAFVHQILLVFQCLPFVLIHQQAPDFVAEDC